MSSVDDAIDLVMGDFRLKQHSYISFQSRKQSRLKKNDSVTCKVFSSVHFLKQDFNPLGPNRRIIKDRYLTAVLFKKA